MLRNKYIFVVALIIQFLAIDLSPTKAEILNSDLTLDKINSSNFHQKAVIQALNKITAKTSKLETKIGDALHFGKLTIFAHKCWQAPLDQMPESKILLEIFDTSTQEDFSNENRIFYGWMLASSPSISDLEHPIYDITAIGCKTDPTPLQT